MVVDPRELARFIESQDPSRAVALPDVLESIRSALGAVNAVAYTPVPGHSHWDLARCHWVGKNAEVEGEALRSYVRSCSADDPAFAVYDPFAVQREQRNRMLSQLDLASLEPAASAIHHRLYRALGKSEREQVRVLICDGPRLLAWVGVVSAEPLDEAQRGLLDSLVGPLHRLLKLENATQRGPLLEALLLNMDQVMFVLDGAGCVELTNQAGERMLGTEAGRAELGRLRESLRKNKYNADYRVTPLRSAGMPDMVLALRDGDSLATPRALAKAKLVWKLSPAMTLSLERLCAGDSNKDIASSLGCAEVTVERYLTKMYNASGARTRAELVAKLHAL